jgi:hypothetical protein
VRIELKTIWIVGLLLLAVNAPAEEWKRVAATLHLHPDIGGREVSAWPAFAALAQKKGIDVLIPTDHFSNRWEYGVPPFEGLVRFTLRRRDVVRIGTEKYASDLMKMEKAVPGLIIFPGVETHVAYRWTGHPVRRDLTLHDSQRHLLVFGLSQSDLETLPVQSNPAAGRFAWMRLVLPALVIGAGLSLMIRWPAGLLLVVLGGLWGFNQRPFRRLPATEDYVRGGYQAAQDLIDYVRARGGIVVWAHPEARNYAEPQKIYRGASVQTLPYPEAVLETDGAAGFGYFWEGSRTVGAPGGTWDRALREYLDGKRRFPVWAFGELDWNEEGRVRELPDQIQNVLWVREKSRTGVLDAFKSGRFSAVEVSSGSGLGLDRWEAVLGEMSVFSGGTTAWKPGARLIARISGKGSATVTVIRNGAAWKTIEAPLPLSWEALLPAPEGTGDFYRLTAKAPAGQVVSNPIFVRSGASAAAAPRPGPGRQIP